MTKPSILLSLILLSAAGLSGAERRVSFNDGWRFFRGEAAGAEQPGFNDKSWMPVQLPHDWAIAGPFDRKINPHAGALPFFGTGWYRKQFTLSAAQKDRRYTIEFDGAMSNARVWLNGKELGGRPYGYIGFALDLTPHLIFDGKPNLLAVRLTPEEFSSRWYPGAGLYRNVWLDETAPVHVAHWGTYITTPAVTDTEATVAIRTSIQNEGPAAARVTVQTTVVDPDGKEVARNGREITLAPGAKETIDEKAAVVRPRRWDIGSPHMYKLVSEVKQGGRVLDRYVTPFGIRTIEFDKTKGFSLNGRHLKIHGVCMHHDLGALGSAVNRRATERQLQIMKSMGVNAVRTSHNPPSPELLEYCDRLGLMVMDEAFDMWQMPKVKNGHSKFFDEWSERDLRDMIRRDRNHPSIVMWSIGNEILEQSKADGWKVAKRLTEITHDEDRTRPVTAGFNQYPAAIKNGLAAQVDIQGFNYKAMNYEEVLKAHPDWMILGAETSSCISSRGVYHLPIQKYEKHESLQLSSYDIIAPPWGLCARRGVRLSGQAAAGAWRVRLDRLRLHRRTDALFLGQVGQSEGLARTQFLFRRRRSGGLPERSLLPVPERVDHEADGTRAAALELGGPRGPEDSGAVLQQRRRSGAIPQRQVAGQEEVRRRANGNTGRRECQ